MLLGAFPIAAWEIFSFFYYGSFVPNSARAKLGTGIPTSRMIEQGAEYFFDSLRIDTLTLVAILAGVLVAIFSGERRARLISLGIILSLGYVMIVGGDFMSGRFFTVQLAASAALIARARWPKIRAIAAMATTGILAGIAGFPTLTDRFQNVPNVELEVVDCRLAFHPFTGFTTGMLPSYIEYGKKLRLTRGVTVQPGIGIAGYYAGPTTKILDAFTLADPLRARLPIPDPKNEAFLKQGHFMRPIPDGYVDSMEQEQNFILDPSVHAYYDVVARVTQGPLFSLERLVDAAKLELGLYDDLLAPYLATYDEKIVHLPDLVHPPGLDPKCYTWWRACSDKGIAFTETGVRIEIGLQVRPSRVHIEATPDEYVVVFRLGGREIRRATLAKGETDVDVNDVLDTVAILPRSGPGRRVLLGFGAAP
jgi:arabinofuranosyltransferase